MITPSRRLSTLCSAAAGAGGACARAGKVHPYDRRLGDVSLTKLIFVVAADAGLYKKNGLDVARYIDPRAAETVKRSGVEVPKEFIRRADGDDVAINIGGGSFLIYSATTDAKATDRVIIATTDTVSRHHSMSNTCITDPSRLKGKRIRYASVSSLTHLMILMLAERMGWEFADGHLDGGERHRRRADETRPGRCLGGRRVARVNLANAGYTDLINLGQLNIPMAGSDGRSAGWIKNNHDEVSRF